ncbi:MAG TPA: LLM class flavin-dependent oxidoreductase [Acidimicrobiales bacterium]|nr:LLM class flavin-dependent oxidoreductase [Acidimicrobiales bacterium]
MRVGVTLPTFRDDDAAVESARRAEALGLDGVFVFDHIWPLGRQDRPALTAFPVLGAVAAVTRRISFGPLVARIGLRPDDLLVAQLASLAAMAPGRLIAGMGTGDSQSAAENEAYGIPPGPADERRLALLRCARRVLDLGVPVWVGGGSTATTELAADLGAGVAVNLWAGQPAAVAALTGRFEVTWGGPVATEPAELAQGLSELATAGATWAVCAWPESLDVLAEVAEMLRGAGAENSG